MPSGDTCWTIICSRQALQAAGIWKKTPAKNLQESAESRLSVPIGPAGTGKTTLLSILYTHPQIATGDVLFWRLRARRGCGWSNRHRSPQGLYDRAIPQPASL
jgi:ABC-type molybdenum transport system ATPase subunit/photorepair protein PhrA